MRFLTEYSTKDLVNVFKDRFVKGEKAILKMHFGEPGNNTAFKPKDVKPFIDALKELGFEVLMVDTPVAYNSPRDSKEGYEKAIEERGYDEVGKYKVIDEYKNVKINGIEFEVAKDLAEATNVLVLSHVKGHECAGFGGAIKNLGMGALSPKTKQMIHNASKPEIDEDKCIGCGVCAELCPAKAISMEKGKANPDWNICWGCSICEINCPQKALTSNVRIFDDVLAMGACAAIKVMPKNTFYVNIINNITKSCDCESDSGIIIAQNIGTLFSDNPIAIDSTSIDIINEKEGRDVFNEVNRKDPKLQLKYAEKYCEFKIEKFGIGIRCAKTKKVV